MGRFDNLAFDMTARQSSYSLVTESHFSFLVQVQIWHQHKDKKDLEIKSLNFVKVYSIPVPTFLILFGELLIRFTTLNNQARSKHVNNVRQIYVV